MGARIARHEILPGDVVEAAGRVIHRPRQHAREGQRHVVRGRLARAPLQVLLAHHAFARHQVGIGAPQSVGLEGAVIIDHQVMLRGFLRHRAVPVHHPLVVAIHEVDLDPRDAPLLKQRKGLVHLPVHRCPVRPQPEPHVLRLGIAQQLRHVDFGIVLVRSAIGGVPAPLPSGAWPPIRRRSACTGTRLASRSRCSASSCRCSCPA